MPERKRFDCITCEGWVGEPRERRDGLEERFCPRFNAYTGIVDYCHGGPGGEPSLSSRREPQIEMYRSQSMDGKRPVRELPMRCPCCGSTYNL